MFIDLRKIYRADVIQRDDIPREYDFVSINLSFHFLCKIKHDENYINIIENNHQKINSNCIR